MNIRMLTTGVCALAFLALAATSARAQSGTIENSWKKAGTETVQPAPAPKVKDVARPAAAWPYSAPRSTAAPATKTGTTGTAASSVWDKGRADKSRPWPYVPGGSSSSQYYSANTQLLDSLGALYCLSAGYLESLRRRNEGPATTTIPAQATRDFAYDKTSPASAPASDRRAELEALYRELLGLLDRCMGNR
jgi:hypothetical protein